MTTTHTRAVLLAVAATVLVTPAGRARAQNVFDVKAASHIKEKYLVNMDTLHSKFMALAEAIPADKYAWRPSKDVRSISEVFVHVATEWYFWAPRGIGGKAPADFGAPKDAQAKMADMEKKIVTKADVIAEMKKAWAYGRAQLAAADPATLTGVFKPWDVTIDEMALEMSSDLHEHLGQLIAYSRSIGVKPPWTK